MSDAGDVIKGRQPAEDSTIMGAHKQPQHEAVSDRERAHARDEGKQQDMGVVRARLIPIPPLKPKE